MSHQRPFIVLIVFAVATPGLFSGCQATKPKLTARLFQTIQAHNNDVFGIAFSPDGNLIATASRDDTAKVWDVESGKQVMNLAEHTRNVYRVAFSPDSKTVATSSKDNTVRLWAVKTGKTFAHLEHDDRVTAVAFSPDGKHIVTGQRSRSGQEVPCVHLWVVATAKKQHTIPDLITQCFDLAFSPDGELLAVALSDQSAVLIDGTSGEQRFELCGRHTWSTGVRFNNDGSRLALTWAPLEYEAGEPGWSVTVWDPVLLKRLWSVHLGDAVAGFPSFDSTGELLAVVQPEGKKITVLDVETGAEALSVSGREFTAAAFHPSTGMLAAATSDGQLLLWSLEKKQPASGAAQE